MQSHHIKLKAPYKKSTERDQSASSLFRTQPILCVIVSCHQAIHHTHESTLHNRQLNYKHCQQKNSYTHHIPISLSHLLLLCDHKTDICGYKKSHHHSTYTCRIPLPIYHGKKMMYTIENKTYKYLLVLPLSYHITFHFFAPILRTL